MLDNSLPDSPEDPATRFAQDPSDVGDQSMHGPFEAYLPTHRYVTSSQQPPSVQGLISNRTPRYIPSNQELGFDPWSSLRLGPEQIDESYFVQEILQSMGPIMTREAREQVGVESSTDKPSDDLVLDQYISIETHTGFDNIDPPACPDPVGPPVDVRKSDYQLASDTYNCAVGILQGSLGHPQEREFGKMTGNPGQCWECALQRVKCEVRNEWDIMCIACTKRRKPSPLGQCIKVKLPDLVDVFLPPSLAQQRDPEGLKSFAMKGIKSWRNNYMEVHLTFGQPFQPICCSVHEFEPRGDSLLVQRQYRLDFSTGQYDLVQIPSPPIGVILMSFPDTRRRLLEYLDQSLEERYFRGFLQKCFRENDCLVERDLLRPIFTYHKQLDDGKVTDDSEGQPRTLIQLALKIVVCTYFMTHALTLVEDTKDEVYRQLHTRPPNAFGIHTSPRFLNKQIKTMLAAIHYDLLRGFLGKFQEAARLATKTEFWASMFSAMVVFAATIESLETTVCCKEETDKGENEIDQSDTTAEYAIRLMEEKFGFLEVLFHKKYLMHSPKGKRMNPIADLKSRRSLLDHASQKLASEASSIINQYSTGPYLIARQTLRPPSTARELHTSRLLARFLLSFSPPIVHDHQPADPASERNTTDLAFTTWTETT
ncbi:MAG: hypothetical protein Q9174_000354 [Haloplaca sp. 1 TL-2023]